MKLDLDNIRIDGGTQSRVELNESVVADYAEILESGETLPPVVVFFDGVDHWLADGFHRYFAHKKIDAVEISADIHDGTRRDAVLFSVGANKGHGLQANRADKRKGAETLLKDAEWAKWSDREIAKKCGLSATTIGAIRSSLSKLDSDKDVERTYTTKHGTTAVMKTASIRKQPTPIVDEEQAAVIYKLSSNAAPAEEIPEDDGPSAQEMAAQANDNDHKLDDAANTIRELSSENEQLRDRLAVNQMDASEEAKSEAAETIAEMRDRIKALEAELDAVKSSRDGFQRENAELKKQIAMNQKQIKKLGG